MPKPETKERLLFGMGHFDLTMSVLTLAGVLVAALTGAIFWRQLVGMETDERAWVSMTIGPASVNKNASTGEVLVQFPITITDSGKTPATRIYSEVVVEKVYNGGAPDFKYDGRVRTENSSGALFPASPQQFIATFSRGKPNTDLTEPRALSPAEYQDLTNGNAYLAVYGETSYDDVFETRHWTTACSFAVAPEAHSVVVTAKNCTDYNDVDNNSSCLLFPASLCWGWTTPNRALDKLR